MKKTETIKKRALSLMMAALTGTMLLAGCGSGTAKDNAAAGAGTGGAAEVSAEEEASGPAGQAAVSAAEENAEPLAQTTITVFAAASLSGVMDELITLYKETQPNVTVTANYDSSGTLMEQIREGADCDIFFSAAQKQMDMLQDEEHLIVEGTRYNVVNNQVVVITYRDSGTEVTGLADLSTASSMALADGSVPVGKYTRQAMMAAGMLEKADDAAEITTAQVSEALGGIEINECGNVSQVAAAVAEGSNEVGTAYYSDTYGMEDKLEILEVVGYDLTGDVIYPVAQIDNPEADDLRRQAALDFVNFLTSDAAKAVFENYYFDTNVEDPQA